jgi:hypothetical protein
METVVNRVICTIVLVFGLVSVVNSQVVLPPLERPITLKLSGQSSKEALKLMEKKGEFTFGYRTDLVEQSNSVRRDYIEKTVREILDDLFQGSVYYKVKGNYIILKSSPKLKEEEISLEGYVIDSKTGLKVPYTSIYDSITLASAVTDEYGHYQLKISKKQTIQLSTKKFGYYDTSFVWKGTGAKVLNIQIHPILAGEGDTTEFQDSLNFFTKLRNLKLFTPSEEQKANMMNFREQFQRKAQFSVIPGVGTNGKLSSTMSVDYSFNLLGGFNGGVRLVEIGVLFNIVWDSVSYFQAAGLFNSVGGPQRGFQAAGLTNINGSSFEGAQFSGLFNYVNGEVRGAQFAGFANAAGSRVTGFQGAGFWNQNMDSSTVVQAAGFGNLTGKATNGTQLAGFINLAGKDFNGTQLAGFINLANDGFRGTQLAGFINVAERMQGTQIGFINISDSLAGAPIGFFSFSRKGLHQLEISTNEIMPVNVGFKSGTNHFYNSFVGGIRGGANNSPYWSFSYGIGSSVRLGDKSRVFFDLQTTSIQRGNTFRKSLLNKLTASYQFNLTKKLALAVGPSFNVFLIDGVSADIGPEMSALTPYSFYDRSFNNDVKLSTWVGGHIAIRLF